MMIVSYSSLAPMDGPVATASAPTLKPASMRSNDGRDSLSVSVKSSNCAAAKYSVTEANSVPGVVFIITDVSV